MLIININRVTTCYTVNMAATAISTRPFYPVADSLSLPLRGVLMRISCACVCLLLRISLGGYWGPICRQMAFKGIQD